ncbi:unnamed protein product, partial [Prorocentrum cordatum]
GRVWQDHEEPEAGAADPTTAPCAPRGRRSTSAGLRRAQTAASALWRRGPHGGGGAEAPALRAPGGRRARPPQGRALPGAAAPVPVRGSPREEVLGHRRAVPWQPLAALASDGVYLVATAVLSGSTLGEEYCELVAVTPALRRASRARRLAAAGLLLLAPAALQQLTAGSGPPRGGGASPCGRLRRALASLVARVFCSSDLAAFYVFGAFRHLSDRCTGIRALSLAERPHRSFSYRPIGFVLFAQILSQACAAVLQWRRGRGGATDSDAKAVARVAAFVSEHSSTIPCPANPKRQPTCNVCFCPAEHATATVCGHIFCWDCIANWCVIKASCPLCRAAVLPQQLLPLSHYEAPPRGKAREAAWPD